MDLQLNNMVAVVMGGSRGIGKAIVECLLNEGCKVAICARNENDLITTANALNPDGQSILTKTADVTKKSEIEAFLKQTYDQFGKIDILINNVGGLVGGRFMQADDADWQQTFDVNVFAAARVSRLAVPYLKNSTHPAIAIISSISGLKPEAYVHYSCAKSAENMLAKAMAVELAPLGIRVNTVCPGSTLTSQGWWEQFKQERPDDFAKFSKEQFPLGRLAKATEIASVVTFLVSPRASWVNGSVYAVDGAQQLPSAY